ncbi:vomeronasal type-1 receptor 4-like [Meles meles]|uniref:vomeronasal type-1 receptor 4-like n=1 Tax=Meles meles TaxID=9662 RepID=UPI001E69F042|nr:vomeronasal type-1 receptor 4-like [Meles meles]
MTTRHLALGMTFLLQTTVGLLGNLFFFYHYLLLYLTRYKLRATDLILKHLTVANLLVIFSKGVPQKMAAFGLKYFLDALGCQLVFYVPRVGTDMVIDTTCLLTLFQVIMISPGDSRWAGLKIRASRYLGTSSILCWVLTVMRCVLIPFYMTDKRNNTNIIVKADHDYRASALQ